ncbi:putative alkyl hydroperoxide reductase/thiol specific antioxidant/Mal allergen [Magnetofaba australis IT-1]|uniref:thioredoxin-dependent peroxiredoxin n=2 Tax=Magnetofaba TaxID=1472292 RepID=A0A1Y2K573_9PROT|nr:putative alkyl hydroperoxide reductase/thiol specific antioxidant/Mal allergen [Magnetofaba australis IT-1]
MSLPDQDGKEWALTDLLGEKGAVFYFYPKDNTPGCTTESMDFQALLPEFEKRGYSVVGISKDSSKSHTNFRVKKGLTFTLLADVETDMCQAFGVWQEKKNYGKTYMGIVRTTFVVDAAGKVAKVYPKVKVKEHAQAVLADLDA